MTTGTTDQVVSAPVHPLQRLSATEISDARTVLEEHGVIGEHTRFTYLGLEEPPKAQVLAFSPGDPVDRRARAILIDAKSGTAWDTVVSLTRRTVDSHRELDPRRDGQPPIMLEDFVGVDEVVKNDPGWVAAMA